MKLLAGVDIGGTKCAVSLAEVSGKGVRLLERERFSTPSTSGETLDRAVRSLAGLSEKEGRSRPDAIGISCGGPLDSRRGLILSPPNLSGWERVDVFASFSRFGVPVGLQNDANAGALAEWMWGAGRGCENLIFLTFGTGMGAGLILNGRLYAGQNDMAGEVGHMRMEAGGPVGYGKAGSFEGFCSGGGIARLARGMAGERLCAGEAPSFCRTPEALSGISAEMVGKAAREGDPLAQEIYRMVGEKLGRGIAFLVDVLNPEKVIIGSIYQRQLPLLEPVVLKVLREEALSRSLSVCEVVPAGLGEKVGDYASLSVAMRALQEEQVPPSVSGI